ncbi:MAG: RecX family transcriptional regulator [Rhodospirillales bacterium]|nr:RecX family transcriptional regulator [Rhodospirillales bacterium]
MDDTASNKQAGRKRKGPRKATAKSLENAAAFYLQRFATSAENLRRVLMRRVERSVRHHGTERDEGAAFIDDIIAKFERLGYLNDTAYAEMRVRGLRGRGQSRRAINALLRQKGLDTDTIDAALAAYAEENEEPERTAAITAARKRRIGPYRTRGGRKENREKDLATLARAGFSYGVALEVIDAESADDLEDRP